MREKVLKQFTQIPASLYVTRGADEQIKRIISDMLRPGYVSVARQMGKTNLLQHAQTSLQNENQIITYIDVSSTFYNNVQDYFRYVIDTILETNLDKFKISRAEIIANREIFSIAPAKEHQNELRHILKDFSGNIIIILDEVDSLVRYEFSDQIFAQIRSIYFMKSTFKELVNLSYILSGVIEPTKIIKSKENSPFNIAQKIYLDDFSRDEFNCFVKQSQLDVIEKSTLERIFYWTNGNPRMTYDVCSEVETLYNHQGVVNECDVNAIVDTLYLSRYDQAPVDHIRDLLSDNALLRNAILDLRKGNRLSDDLKNQLYLYGIIDSNFESPYIKNPIIDRAISEDWLTNLEIQNRGLYIYSLECIGNQRYAEAIKSLIKYIDSFEEDDLGEINEAKYHLGIAYSALGEYEKSNIYLTPQPIEENPENYILYSNQINTIAINYIALNEYDLAESFLKKVIQYNKKDEPHIRALLNTSAIYARKNDSLKMLENSQTAIEYLTDNTKIKSNIRKKYISIAYYNAGQAIEKDKTGKYTKETVLSNYENAFKYAESSLKPSILLKMYHSYVSLLDKKKVLTEAVDIIIDKKLVLSEKSLENEISFSEDDLNSIISLSYMYLNDKFEELIAYVSRYIFKSTSEITLFNLATDLADSGALMTAKELFEKIISMKDSVSMTRRCYRHIVLIDRHLGLNYNTNFNEYFKMFIEDTSSEPLEELDVTVFINVLLDLREKGDYKHGILYSNAIEIVLKTQLLELQYERLMLYFLISDFNVKSGDIATAKYNALISLTLIKQIEKHVNDYKQVNSENISYVKKLVQQTAFGEKLITPSVVINSKKKRNQLVTVKSKSGDIIKGKFKLFEKGLEKGEYILIGLIE